MNSPGAALITAIVMPSKQQTELGGPCVLLHSSGTAEEKSQ